MKEPFLLSDSQMMEISPLFPLTRGVSRIDDRKIVSGIIYVLQNGIQWKDVPEYYGVCNTIYNRFIRWCQMGIFEKVILKLNEMPNNCDKVIISENHIRNNKTASRFLRKKSRISGGNLYSFRETNLRKS